MLDQKQIGVIVVSSLLCFGFAANALAVHATEETATAEVTTTTSQDEIILQLQKQILELQKQMTQMQEQLNALIKTPQIKTTAKTTIEVKKQTKYQDGEQKGEIYQFSGYLSLGTKNDEVYALQKFLASDSKVYPEGKVTGYFGPLTEAAVKRFQDKYGIETAGVVGPKTRTKINTLMEGEQYSYKTETATQEKTKEQTQTSKTTDAESAVKSITAVAGDNGKVTWTVDGNSVKGFKIAWSKTSGPTYPTRSGDKYQYLSSPDANSAILTAFDGNGVYYVRVCEYLGGACGIYSNEVQIEL